MNTAPADLSRPGDGWVSEEPAAGFLYFRKQSRSLRIKLGPVSYVIYFLGSLSSPLPCSSEDLSGPICCIAQVQNKGRSPGEDPGHNNRLRCLSVPSSSALL